MGSARLLANVEAEGKRTIEPRGVLTLHSPCLPAGVMLSTRVYVWKLSPFLSDSRMRWATTFQGYSEPARQEMRACADFNRETCVRKDKTYQQDDGRGMRTSNWDGPLKPPWGR